MSQQQEQLTAAQLTACLAALVQPDTAAIRAAEAQLKPHLKVAATMDLLWQATAAVNTTDVAIRHVAVMVLRKKLPVHYEQFHAEQRTAWMSQVLQAAGQEQVRPIKNGLTAVAAALGAVDQKATPVLLQFLQAAVADPAGRELAFALLTEMTDTVGLYWKDDHAAALLQLFQQCLSNPTESAATHKAACQAAGQLMSFWADDTEALEPFVPLVPVLLHVTRQHAAQDDDFLGVVLDVLYDLAHAPAVDGRLLAEFARGILQDANMDLRTRDAAALVIATTAEAKPVSIGRETALLNGILDTLFQLMQDSEESAAGALFETNPAWRQDLDNPDDIDEDPMDSPSQTSMAQGTLDMLACEIPKKYIWEPLLQRCCQRMESNEPAARKAGVAGLGVIAEGCADPLTAALPQVVPAVLASARDAAPAVRECSCFCLGQLSEHCQPDILRYSTDILPIVFGLLDDQSVTVQATSCYVLEMFCERLEPAAVRPFLDPLVRKLAAMLESTDKRSVQEMAVAALAATAVAAEEEFTPYVPGVANLMTRLMNVTDPNLFSLRGRATECMGHVGIAVGRDTFRPYFVPTMQAAMAGLHMDSTDLEEFAYAAFANLAKVLKEEFAVALPELVPILVKVIGQDEGQLENAPSTGQFAGLDDSDDEDNENNLVLHVRTALLDVKKGAITALAEMAAHTGTPFCPYLEASIQILLQASNNWHPVIKSEVAEALPNMVVPMIAAHHNGKIEWTKGDMQNVILSQQTLTVISAVLTAEMTLLQDEDRGTVAKASEAIQSVIELGGPNALALIMESLLPAAHAFLEKSAPCQTTFAELHLADEESDEHDVLLQSICDLIGAFGRVLGSQFAQYLPQFIPAINNYSKSGRPAADRSMAYGCLAEIAQEVPGIQEYWKPVFLPAILAGLSDEDESCRRNAAFCAGLCCENLKELAVPDYAVILQPLGTVFGATDPACRDNAAAAVARMIMAAPQHVPLAQVLPVFLQALPLQADMSENETVYTCLAGLVGQVSGAELQRIVGAAGEQINEELRGQLQQAAMQQQQ